MALEVTPIPAFNDNYLWLLHNGTRAVVVDPGDAAPVLRELAARGLELTAILVTHHHGDHIGGLAALLRRFPVPVYGPASEAVTGVTTRLNDGDVVSVLGEHFSVIDVPGHTAGHIAYHGAGMLFCGDTLFAGGCGRLFEGTALQMQASLAKLAALPGTTRVYCAHEYTLANLEFALAAEPDNVDLLARVAVETDKRARGLPTVPSTIALERATNPFLRWAAPSVRASAERQAGRVLSQAHEVFGALRAWKNQF